MKHRYHILEWKAPDIASFLGLGGVTLAVFNFDKPMLGYFLLLVAGFDDKGDFPGTSPIEKYPGVAEPDLDNAYSQGIFFVMAADIKTYSAQGTKPLFFVPKAYTPPGAIQKYVSYTTYDAPPHNGSFDGMVVVGSMNPSPPRNP